MGVASRGSGGINPTSDQRDICVRKLYASITIRTVAIGSPHPCVDGQTAPMKKLIGTRQFGEVAGGLAAVRDTHGGESILYYGGGGQGNHLGGSYSTAVRAVLGSRFRASALAQEKTGEFWVNVEIGRSHTRGGFRARRSVDVRWEEPVAVAWISGGTTRSEGDCQGWHHDR